MRQILSIVILFLLPIIQIVSSDTVLYRTSDIQKADDSICKGQPHHQIKLITSLYLKDRNAVKILFRINDETSGDTLRAFDIVNGREGVSSTLKAYVESYTRMHLTHILRF